MQYRHELKYLITSADYALIRARLAPVMRRDQHVNGGATYNIRTLYFDDLYNTAYHEKYTGEASRQKYRIRLYNHSDRVIHLERKIKYDRHVHKQTASLSRQQVEEVLAGHYDGLRECDDPLLKLFYYECRAKLLRPRVIVEYDREPFVMQAGQVRVTFDQHVRVGLEGWDIFNQNMAMREVLEPGFLVMEVKYSEFLPSLVQQLLPRHSAHLTAVSKYVLGCDQTLYLRMVDF